MAPTANPAAHTRPATRRHWSRLARTTGVLVVVTTILGLGWAVDANSALARPARPRLIHGHTVRWTENHIRGVIQQLINSERRAHGRHALRVNTRLRVTAHDHNLDMARYDLMSHQLPGEPYFATRFTDAGYRWVWAGENIAWNSDMSQAGVVELEQLMYNERPPYDDHRVNILNPHFRDLGVDVYFDDQHGRVWLTTDFGRR
jgi:uncharacterized protein YkwD